MEAMNTHMLDAQQQTVLAVDLEIDGVTVVGASGSGKSTTLFAHLRRCLDGTSGRVLALTGANVHAFREDLSAEFSQEQALRITVCTPLQFALMQAQLLPNLRVLDAYQAEVAFTRSAAPLLALAWPTLESGEIDPEVSGLRSPERFIGAAFRLMLKLLASGIEPATIQESALRATTQFYARPPNFADAELLRGIKEEYRSSLRVDRGMLEHQCRREIDLTRIVVKLFADFADLCTHDELITEAGFILMLTAHFSSVPAQAEILRRRFRAVVVDDAQDLLVAELALLKSIWGDKLPGVMMAGDIQASMASFRGARSQATLATTEHQIILHARRRGTVELIEAQQAIFSHPDAPSIPDDAPADPASLSLERCQDAQRQAEAIAAFIGDRLSQGTSAAACAVAMRTLRCSHIVIEALLAHDIPVDCSGDIDFAADATTMDFVALLWCVTAPEKRPDAVLRILASQLLNLSDRSIAVLSSPHQDPMLFAAEPSARGRDKGDRTKQFLENVFAGINDHALGDIACRRLGTFRENIARWREQLQHLSFREFLIDVATESGIGGGGGVRARFSRNLIGRVVLDLVRIQAHEASQSLAVILAEWDARIHSVDEERVYEQIDRGAVCVAAVNALRGRSFDCVAIADARAGAFPRYYVPDIMLYSPQRGFVGRENAGSTASARTAKYTWYFEKTRVRDAYNSEERKMFSYAIGRARKSVLITAWGPATRGKTAPEFLEEVRATQKVRRRS